METIKRQHRQGKIIKKPVDQIQERNKKNLQSN